MPPIARALVLLAAIAAALLTSRPAQATPQWARQYGVQSCNTCHTVIPRLNLRGMDFLARGYRPDPKLDMQSRPTFPASVWLGMRYDDRIADHKSATYMNKVELLSGGPIGDEWNYFVEWRAFDLELQSNGTLRDRSGRFEDLWLNWQEGRRWSVTFGQYRPVFQLEPGRKISLSTPAIFTTSLAGDKLGTPRLTGLSAFSPDTRQPQVSVVYQSIPGEQAMDGLYHNLTLPFTGEFSIPLGHNAQKNASFEFEPRLKGVFLETYYRKGYNSIGVHGLVGDSKYLANLVGTAAFGDLYLLGGMGVAREKSKPEKVTSTLELEYLPQLSDEAWRPGFGFRVENVSHSGRGVAYVPYVVLAAPNKSDFSSLLQLEYFGQKGHERMRVDFSVIF